MPDLGVTVTTGVSNADGSPIEILPALTHDVHRLVVHFASSTASGTDTATLIDILRDPAGGSSWASFIDDLPAGFLSNDSTVNNAVVSSAAYFDFPVFIPAGTSLGAQGRTAHSVARDIRVSVWAFGEPSRPEMWWCGQGVETLGANAAASKGTPVTPGASGTWGSWTDIGSPTSHRYGAIVLGLGGTDSVALARHCPFQVGHGSQPLPGWPLCSALMGTAEGMAYVRPNGVINCDIAAGTQMQARATCNSTAEDWDVLLYGVY
jgi:hypothetical protein